MAKEYRARSLGTALRYRGREGPLRLLVVGGSLGEDVDLTESTRQLAGPILFCTLASDRPRAPLRSYRKFIGILPEVYRKSREHVERGAAPS